MKKIYYLLAYICVVFASCKPLSQTYSDIDSASATGTLSLNLSSVEYKMLNSTLYSYNLYNFKSATDANVYIPTILSTKYPTSPNLTSANVTFALAPSSSSVAVPDSTYAHIALVLGPTDYVFPGNTYADFSATTALSYLAYKYPTPAANQMVIMTYNYFESGVTASAGTLTTDTFVYLNGAWTKLYTISANQYASINRGVNNSFVAGDVPSLAFYINGLLKADQNVMATAKTGDVKYVSYRMATTYEKVLTLTYNGSNWIPKQTLAFLKINGTWLPDPTVTITEATGVNADFVWLNTNTTIGSDLARANLASFGDFNISSSGTTTWSDAEVTAAIAAILLHRFPSPIIGVPYKVIYYVYSGSTTATSKTYTFNGTAFTQQ